jgi:uracil-DNA glycosylase family 4
MTPDERQAAMIALGRALDGRDLDVYAAFGRDPDAPIVGEGDPRARICVFGRDPGREEVRHGVPFVGAGGQKVRQGLHRALSDEPYDFDAGILAGERVFWANMVPYKPFENKAWPTRVIQSFRPLIFDILAESWRGTDVIALGQGAFEWFGLGDKAVKAALKAHWAGEDRYERAIEVPLGARVVRLHPLPHPSPLNATWTPRFPGMLDARLRSLGLRDAWRMEDPG